MSAQSGSESETTKVIQSAHHTAAVWWLSCLLPEATKFQVNQVPIPPQTPGVYNVLVVAGNLSAFNSDMIHVLIEYWTGAIDPSKLAPKDRKVGGGGWDHVIFTPGPFDYSKGTVCFGDKFARELQRHHGEEKFTVLMPGQTDTLFLTGPSVRFVGAPCWPSSDAGDIYKCAAVYELPDKYKTDLDAKLGPGVATESEYYDAWVGDIKIAMANRCYLGEATARTRLNNDIATIVSALRTLPFHFRQQETRIVVTYGCPDQQLFCDHDSDSRAPMDQFRGVFALPKQLYDYLDGQVDWWIVGATCDKPRARMGKNIKVCSNQYIRSDTGVKDGFQEPFSGMMKFRKPMTAASEVD